MNYEKFNSLSLSLLINRIKQQKQNKEKIIILSFSVIISILFVSTITYGATTIGNNITSGGNLTNTGTATVYGATSIGGALSATSTLTVTGLTTLANASTTQLSIAGNLWINGNATTTSTGNIQGQGILTMLGTGTSTFSGGIQSTALNITSATASSTFANGIILSKGCFLMPDGTCAGAGGGAISFGTNPTVDTLGQIALDTTRDQLLYYSGGKVNVLQATSSFSFLVPSPSGFSGKDYPLKKLNNNITISKINCITDPTDATGVEMQIDLYEANSTGDATTTVDAIIICDNDGATDDGSLTNPTIDLNDWLGVHFYTASGTPQSVTVDVQYTIDRQ